MTFGRVLIIDMLSEIPIINCNDRITMTDILPLKENSLAISFG